MGYKHEGKTIEMKEDGRQIFHFIQGLSPDRFDAFLRGGTVNRGGLVSGHI